MDNNRVTESPSPAGSHPLSKIEKTQMGSEENLIRQIRSETEAVPELTRWLERGIGDDAALLKRFAGNMAVTADMLCDGVDFICGKDCPEEIGRKSLAVNLSDLAAMGAVPMGVVISVVLPESASQLGKMPVSEFSLRFYRGMVPLAKRFGVSIAGGDTNSWKGPFAVSVTAMGNVLPEKAFYRSGARPGDRILVTGAVGGSIFHRQFHFIPRILEALFLSRYAEIHGGLDISDGLELDLSRIARESGTGYRLDRESVPIHRDVLYPPRNFCEYPGWEEEKTPLEHALSDGEDFELILAVPPEEAARLVREQPFLAAAGGEPEPLRLLRDLAEEYQFSFTEEDRRSLSEVKLTDIGEFTLEPLPPFQVQMGWEYRF